MKQRKIEKTVEQIMHQIANEPNLFVSIEPVIDSSQTQNPLAQTRSQLAVFINTKNTSDINWVARWFTPSEEILDFFGAPAESLEFCHARAEFFIPLQYFPEEFEDAFNLHKQLSPCH